MITFCAVQKLRSNTLETFYWQLTFVFCCGRSRDLTKQCDFVLLCNSQIFLYKTLLICNLLTLRHELVGLQLSAKAYEQVQSRAGLLSAIVTLHFFLIHDVFSCYGSFGVTHEFLMWFIYVISRQQKCWCKPQCKELTKLWRSNTWFAILYLCVVGVHLSEYKLEGVILHFDI